MTFIALVGIHLIPLFFSSLSGIENSIGLIYFIAIGLGTPFLFIFSQKNKLDAILGEFSYPVYLSHFLVIKLVNNLSFFTLNPMLSAIGSLLLTFVLSGVLIKFIEKPINLFRQKRVRGHHYR